MIKSFANKALENLFLRGSKKGVDPNHAQKLVDILDMLHAATDVRDMSFPGSRLHPLKGDLKGYWAVMVSGNWRVIFRFDKGDARDVDYVDYH